MIPSLPLIPAQAGIQPNQQITSLVEVVVLGGVRVGNGRSHTVNVPDMIIVIISLLNLIYKLSTRHIRTCVIIVKLQITTGAAFLRYLYSLVCHLIFPFNSNESAKNISRTTIYAVQSRNVSLDTRLRGYERAFWGYVNQGKNKKTAMLINVKTERALS